jgi:hypothetical protein
MHIRESATPRKFAEQIRHAHWPSDEDDLRDFFVRRGFIQIFGPARIAMPSWMFNVRQWATAPTRVAATAGRPDLFTASARIVTN